MCLCWKRNDVVFSPTSVAVLSFIPDEYTVVEGESVDVCVSVVSPDIECPVNFDFYLQVSTSADDAG